MEGVGNIGERQDANFETWLQGKQTEQTTTWASGATAISVYYYFLKT